MSIYSDTVQCACGCGLPAPLAQQTETKRGYVEGCPRPYRVGHNQKAKVRQSGYRLVCVPGHPRASSKHLVLEHILIVERALGHPLPAGAETHHFDGNSLNNDPRNLVICQSRAYHKLLHVRQRVVAAGGNPNTDRLCGMCGPRPMSEFYLLRVGRRDGRCKACRRGCDKGRWRRGPKDYRERAA